MADPLSTADWQELYRYLLEQLDSRGMLTIRQQIEEAAAAPVQETRPTDDDARYARVMARDFGRAAIRKRGPEEAFLAAMGILESRLLELPAVAGALAANLSMNPSHIEFRVDFDEDFAPTTSGPLALSRLAPENPATELIRGLLIELTSNQTRLPEKRDAHADRTEKRDRSPS